MCVCGWAGGNGVCVCVCVCVCGREGMGVCVCVGGTHLVFLQSHLDQCREMPRPFSADVYPVQSLSDTLRGRKNILCYSRIESKMYNEETKTRF